MRFAVAGGTGMLGRYVVEAAKAAGHEAVVMSRSRGVDVVTGAGLDAALTGVEVIVDAANTPNQSRAKATEFFEAVAGNLQQSGSRAGVKRIVTLSIVGIERVPKLPYYAAKLAHEAAARRGPLPVTVLRATQFHEFPIQVLQRIQIGPVTGVPRFRVQPVAARALGEVAVEVAADAGAGDFVNVGGPEGSDLVTLCREVVRHLRLPVKLVLPVPFPGPSGRAMRGGALCLVDVADARVVGPTFSDWLAGPDAEAAVRATTRIRGR
jgi:uncharacterized protein YbjT (DUF2867 family)